MPHPFRRARFALSLALSLPLAGAVFAASNEGPAQRQQEILDLQPVAYWPLDENTTDHVVRDRSLQ